MALLARLNDFTPSTVIVSQQVDDEFNQLVNILNGGTTNKDALIKFSDATNPVLRVDQISTGTIQQWLVNGTEKVSIRNNGALRINSTQAAADPLKLAISCDANNLGNIVASLQTVGVSDIAMRLAMEAASSGGVTAFQITKFDGAAVQQYFQVTTNGEVRTSAGYPSVMANVPTGVAVCLGGQYQQNVTATGNVLGGEDDLHSYTIAANVFAKDGDSIDFTGGGTVLAVGTTKRFRIFFAGTMIYDTTLFDPAVDNIFSFNVTIIRVNSNTVAYSMVVGGNTNDFQIRGFSGTITGLTFTGTLILKCTGEDTDGVSNRVVVNASMVRKFGKGS